ncbi:MAG TPA: winged helix-turn-helix domain-containing protein [Gaiellaceae bacterium]|nr:winged helix-turn-helix domain-containing protein [Gaiellaceae bacterium]
MSFKKNRHDQLELTDPRAMRALAHPVRLDILAALSAEPLTATQCAERVGESPQSCSYHLRTLAKHGFVEPAEAGNGKERPWKKVARGLRWSGGDDADAARALAGTFLARDFRLAQQYLATPREDWPEPMYTQATLRLTPAEAEELGKKLFALLEPYFPAKRKKAPDDAIDVWWASFGVPSSGA